jgi:hypothetical protein
MVDGKEGADAAWKAKLADTINQQPVFTPSEEREFNLSTF